MSEPPAPPPSIPSQPQPPLKLAIIGSAGRTPEERRRLTSPLLPTIWCSAIGAYLREKKIPRSRVHLVSGGSAFADQVAVQLYLDWNTPGDPLGDAPFAGLTLHLPVPFDLDSQRFAGDRGTAAQLNNLHENQQRLQGTQSLQELARVMRKPGVTVVVHDGFLARDRAIAREADILIAFSGNDGIAPKEGSGTEYTWRHTPKSCTKVCFRLPLAPDELRSGDGLGLCLASHPG